MFEENAVGSFRSMLLKNLQKLLVPLSVSYTVIHPSRTYVTLAIEPRFCVCGHQLKPMSQSQKRCGIAKVSYFPEACIV